MKKGRSEYSKNKAYVTYRRIILCRRKRPDEASL